MKIIRPFLLGAAVSVLAGAGAPLPAQTPDAGANPVQCAGTVTDAAGSPVVGATVEYWRYRGIAFLPADPELKKQITTAADGAFEFQVSRDAGFLLARKPGLAPAWKMLNQRFNPVRATKQKMVLTPPGTMAGVLLDESNQPVAGAAVFVSLAFSEIAPANGGRTFDYLTGKPARDLFAARTDAAGRFRIENFPTNAGAAFAVELPGKVLRPSPEDFNGPEPAGWHAGQDEVKLFVEPAGGIEGKIIGVETNQPLPVARLTLQTDQPGYHPQGGPEPAQSGADGTFRINDVAAGAYHVHAVFGTNALSDWVAEAVPVSVEAGQTTRGVQITAQPGALLEVTVLGKNDRKPLPQISVSAYRENSQATATADAHGVARLRLLPGDYQLAAFQESMPAGQTSASVEAGTTNRVELEIAAPQKISGLVRAPDGRPAAGVPVRMIGGFGAEAAEVETDANGKFDLEWNRRQLGGQNDATGCVLVRDAEHNLAVAQDVDEDTGPLDLQLAPALTLAGRAESDGKPVTNATAALVFWTGRSGSWLQGLARTNAPGQFEIPALPPGRKYGVIVSAPGYGQRQMQNLEISADAGRQELDPAELKPANLKLAGQVLDADDQPVAGCYVNLNGDGQPSGNARTDRSGRFVFAHVCEGSLQLSANSQRSFGNISAEGGDTNVVLRLGQTYSAAPGSKLNQLKGTVTDAEGKPVPGAQVAVFPNNGPSWVKADASGAFHLTWSLQPWQTQSGGALLVGRETVRNLAATEELPEEATNLDVQLKPALTVAGQVNSVDAAPLAGAQVGVWLKAGNSYNQLNEPMTAADAQGRYEIKCLPPEAKYIIFATAKGHGRSEQQLEPDPDTNRLELPPFTLKLADRVLAGQVLNESDQPVSGVNVSLNGEGQPDGYLTTDSKGRFHFQVCAGPVRLFASSQNGFAQASAEAGDTNVVLTLSAQPGNLRQAPRRTSLKGGPLPDLAGVNLAGDAAPVGQSVLLCLFDAGQRPSRHVLGQLNEQAAALRQKNVRVLGVQAVLTGDEPFNDWQRTSPVSFPVGRVAEKSEKTKWATSVSALPWLILTDADHRVVAEGFSLDELDAQIQKLTK